MQLFQSKRKYNTVELEKEIAMHVEDVLLPVAPDSNMVQCEKQTFFVSFSSSTVFNLLWKSRTM
jgi:hypothetical protein